MNQYTDASGNIFDDNNMPESTTIYWPLSHTVCSVPEEVQEAIKAIGEYGESLERLKNNQQHAWNKKQLRGKPWA